MTIVEFQMERLKQMGITDHFLMNMKCPTEMEKAEALSTTQSNLPPRIKVKKRGISQLIALLPMTLDLSDEIIIVDPDQK